MALADYSGKTVDKHLSFQKGELILVREQKDTRWYSGQLRGKVDPFNSYQERLRYLVVDWMVSKKLCSTGYRSGNSKQ